MHERVWTSRENVTEKLWTSRKGTKQQQKHEQRMQKQVQEPSEQQSLTTKRASTALKVCLSAKSPTTWIFLTSMRDVHRAAACFKASGQRTADCCSPVNLASSTGNMPCSSGCTQSCFSIPDLEKKNEKKTRKRKDYAFRRQFAEKPSVILGCPGP